MKSLRLLLADDHAIVLEGLRRLLEPDFEIVGEVRDGRALVAESERLRPELIICDISMPLLNGIEAARQIRRVDGKVKIVFLTMHPDVSYAAEALAIRGSAYVLKSSAGSEIREAIHDLLLGRAYLTSSVDAAQVRAQMVRNADQGTLAPQLTPRQREVLQLLAEGRRLKEIATILNISVKTAEFHKYRIMQSLGVNSTAELTKYAVKSGMTTL